MYMASSEIVAGPASVHGDGGAPAARSSKPKLLIVGARTGVGVGEVVLEEIDSVDDATDAVVDDDTSVEDLDIDGQGPSKSLYVHVEVPESKDTVSHEPVRIVIVVQMLEQSPSCWT